MALKFKCLWLVAAAIFACTTMVSAQDNRGTPEQRTACVSDAFRLCGSYVPDGIKVEYCLRQKKSELSHPCKLVFEQGK